MPKQVTHFICQNCGWESPKWEGKCSSCGQWNTLVETVIAKSLKSFKTSASKALKPLKLSQVKDKTFKRVSTKISEFDRVLGGGIVPGSLVLISGEPGIGKSTLLTQLALSLSNRGNKGESSILYVCGEESPEQIKIRINRLQSSQKPGKKLKFIEENLLFLPETDILAILSTVDSLFQTLNLLIVDSIQTIWSEKLTGIAGSVGQVKECSNMLLTLAKKTNIPIFLVGHITKEGAIAGPKVLEHLVDTVLYLEGEKNHDFRILRTSKNRFGPTDEVGVFRMSDQGMQEVKNPGDLFLEDQAEKPKPGSATVATIQGIRPMLIEIQALVIPSQLAVPRRVASGIDYKKLQVLCAVLQKRLNIPLATSDVFVNVAGGLKLQEPAIDLGVSLAILSSFKNKVLPKNSVCIGEVGLLGEIRRVSFMDKRIKEAKKLGFNTVIGQNQKDLRQVLRFIK
jgi:DNA repair protein RadA/Sms